jgi:hypothetical protein
MRSGGPVTITRRRGRISSRLRHIIALVSSAKPAPAPALVECAGSNYFLNLRGHETREVHRFPNCGNLGGYGAGVARAEWLKPADMRREIELD